MHDEIGNINNFVEVHEPTARQLFPKRPDSPPGEYAQEIPSTLQSTSTQSTNTLSLTDSPSSSPGKSKATRVPNIPPHLLRALLNTAPSPDDPSTLPLPHHVMVNHVYALPRSTHSPDLTVLGATHMYRNKYVTSVYYRKREMQTNV